MAYRSFFGMQKQWSVEVARCINKWANVCWDADEMTWSKPSATHWLNHWTDKSVNQWLHEHWPNESMNAFANEPMNQRTIGSMNQWVSELVSPWMNQWTNDSVKLWITQSVNHWINEWVNKWVDGSRASDSVNQWINEVLNQWVNEATQQWGHEPMKQQINEAMDQWFTNNGSMNPWPMNQWIHETHESTNERMTGSSLGQLLSQLLLLWAASYLAHFCSEVVPSFLFYSFCDPILLCTQPAK